MSLFPRLPLCRSCRKFSDALLSNARARSHFLLSPLALPLHFFPSCVHCLPSDRTSGRMEAAMPDVYRRWRTALSKLVRERRQTHAWPCSPYPSRPFRPLILFFLPTILQEIHPSSLTPSYGEALEIAQRLALDGFLSLSKTRQSWAPFLTLELQVGRGESGEGNGSSKTAWQMQG